MYTERERGRGIVRFEESLRERDREKGTRRDTQRERWHRFGGRQTDRLRDRLIAPAFARELWK